MNPTPSRLRQGQHCRDDYIIYMYLSLSLPLPLIHTYMYTTPTARDDTSSEAILAGVI